MTMRWRLLMGDAKPDITARALELARRHDVQTDKLSAFVPPREEVDRVARLLIAAWERVEKAPVNVSYVATFADMARAIIMDAANAAPAVAAVLRALVERNLELEAEAMRLKVANASLVPDAMLVAADVEATRLERDSARSEVERLRPVVEAAERMVQHGYPPTSPVHLALLDAIDVYRATKGTP